MIRIGDFARMARVSVATLRLYDEQGLLKPAEVDEGSGYRHYKSEQLVELHRITVLKSLGFTLREIRSLLNDNVKPEGMSALLAQKRKSAEDKLQKEKQKMKNLELQIQIIQGFQTMTIADVQMLTVPEIRTAAVHLVLPTNDQAADLIGGAFDQLFGSLHQQGIEPKGPCMTVWESSTEAVTDEVLDVAVPIDADVEVGGGLSVVTLPSHLIATVTHRGPFSEFQTCHIVLKEWLAANRYVHSGPYREIYHTPPGDESVTEVQYPIVPM